MPATPLRRLVAALAVGAAALAGCGQSSDGGATVDALSQVKVTGGEATKAPEVTLATKPLKVKETEVKVLKEGTGATVTKDDIASVNAAVVNGTDGKLLDETWSATPVGIDIASQNTFAAIRTALRDQKVGARLLIASPPKDAFGEQGRDTAGVAPTDSIVFLVDILGTTRPLTQATGKPVAPKAGLPAVAWKPDAAATITIPKGAKPPAKLVVQKLIQGAGPVVAKGKNARVSYTGALWRDGKTFDSSMTKEPHWYEFPVGGGQVIPGWDKALTGAKVGDRLLLVIPPADGYGAQGNPSSQPPIKGTDTLVFVVDVLATY